MTHLSIRLLGGFQVDMEGAPIVDFRSDKARALLAFLAVEADRPHARDSLAWLLWPDSPNQRARTNLRSTLANLRKVLNDPRSSPPHLLIDREAIQFNKDSDHWLDWSAFVSTPAEIRVDAAHLERFEGAIALYRGPFLSGFSVSDSSPFEEWTILKREQINQRVMGILCSLAAYYGQQGEHEIAQTHARKMVELEPWNEEAHRQLMHLLVLGGQRSAALAQYEACRRNLAEELDVEPSRETIALYEAIRDGETGTFFSVPALQFPGIQIMPEEAEQPVFVGRQAELDKLNDALEKTLAGKGRVVFVAGSAGSGKTTLLDEFVRRAMQAHSNLITAAGICNAYSGIGDPYLPFLEIMGLLTGDVETRLSSRVISRQHTRRLWAVFPSAAQALVEFGPDLINRMIGGAALVRRARAAAHFQGAWLDKLQALVERWPVDVQGATLQQVDLFEQYTRVLLALARLHSLILVIDDLQWADMGSISLLFHLGRRLGGSRILVVGAYRPEEVALGRDGKRHSLESVVLTFQSEFGESPIILDQSEGREFVEAFLDSEPNRLGTIFRQTLFRQTSGHPLFTIELLRNLQERGDLIRDEDGQWAEGNTLSWDTLPVRVEAVIAERMGRLPLELRRVLDVASVEGEEFTAEVIAEVLHVDKELLVRQLSEQLERRHRLIAATQSRGLDERRISRYRFQHHLFQIYLYGSLDIVERANFHEGIGRMLERFYQEHPGEMDAILVILARHFQDAGIPQKAMNYLRLSGEMAERLSASAEASSHYRNALALCAKLPRTLERDQTELALNMALGAQLVASNGFTSSEAVQIYSRARQLCQDLSQRLGDSTRTPTLLIPVLLGLGAFYGHQAQYQAAREVYDQIFALASASGDPELMMLAYWGPAYLLVQRGEFLSARSNVEKALQVYDPHKHQRLITIFTLDMGVSCLSWLSFALFFLGYPDQALKRSGEAIALARQIGHPFSLAFALSVASILRGCALDAQGTQELAEEAIAICSEKGFLYWLGVAMVYRGLGLAWQGKYNEGFSQMREGDRIWRESGAEIGLSEYLISLAEVLGNAGQVEQGLGVLEEAFEKIIKSGETVFEAEIYRVKGELLIMLSHENRDKAEACFREAIAITHKQQAKILELRATTDLSSVLARQGRRSEARQLLEAIYGWFTEGFETRDLRFASRLLRELSEECE
jgi:DNA-binding SARP family transcriptional activator/predicted ATPase